MGIAESHILQLPLSRTSLEYRIRCSARAKRISLKVSAAGQAEVVVPVFLPVSEGISFAETHALWLERALRKMQTRVSSPSRRPGKRIYPDFMDFAAAERKYPVDYEWIDVCWVGIREEKERLAVSGAILDQEALFRAFHSYLLRKAEEILTPLMQLTSEECGIVFHQLTYRIQQGRWGSCSGRGSISLNALLLFFPVEYARYVMIHELCHMVEMNHSERFWNLVGSLCRDYRYLRSSLNRECVRKIPPFLLRRSSSGI